MLRTTENLNKFPLRVTGIFLNHNIGSDEKGFHSELNSLALLRELNRFGQPLRGDIGEIFPRVIRNLDRGNITEELSISQRPFDDIFVNISPQNITHDHILHLGSRNTFNNLFGIGLKTPISSAKEYILAHLDDGALGKIMLSKSHWYVKFISNGDNLHPFSEFSQSGTEMYIGYRLEDTNDYAGFRTKYWKSYIESLHIFNAENNAYKYERMIDNEYGLQHLLHPEVIDLLESPKHIDDFMFLYEFGFVCRKNRLDGHAGVEYYLEQPNAEPIMLTDTAGKTAMILGSSFRK